MSEDDEGGRTTWVPMAIAGGLVAVILTVIFTVDGSSDSEPADRPSPSSTVAP